MNDLFKRKHDEYLQILSDYLFKYDDQKTRVCQDPKLAALYNIIRYEFFGMIRDEKPENELYHQLGYIQGMLDSFDLLPLNDNLVE